MTIPQLRNYRYLNTARLYDYLSTFESSQWSEETETHQQNSKETGTGLPQFDRAANEGEEVRSLTKQRVVSLANRHAFSRLYDNLATHIQEFDEFTDLTLDVKKGSVVEVTRTFTPSPVASLLDSVLQLGGMLKQFGPQMGQDMDSEALRQLDLVLALFGGNSAEAKVIPIVSDRDGSNVAVLFNAEDVYVDGDAEELGGELTVFGTINKVIPAGKDIDLLALTKSVPKSLRSSSSGTSVMRNAMVQMLQNVPEGLGNPVAPDQLSLAGPVLIVSPVACYTS
ncbi:DUF6414 family protein [Dactylosporangium sp. CA-139066]|uniref:DUF6414 family protein n=1 Tax=Dactylosporangium sp. CA-139066 TaxID=3239930 RepID=UPI003D950582